MALSDDVLPSCWSDDTRMNALFAPFRLKTVNPFGWESKMNFWLDLMNTWCEASNTSSFTLRELKSTFKRKNKTPACLETVMVQMLENGSVKKLSDIQNDSSETWVNWGVKQILRPASWAVSKFLSPIRPSEKVNQDDVVVVHLETLKKQALQLFSSVSDDKKIGYIAELKKTVSDKYNSTTITLILNWLVTQKLAILSNDGSIYKFAQDKNSKVNPITEGEVCLLQLSQAILRLEDVMKNLDKNISDSIQSVKQHLANKNKSLALHHLKIKKKYEARLLKISNSAETLINLSESIKQTHTDAEILAAYNKGLKGLKGTMEATGLTENNVLDTMDDLKQILEDYSDVQAALSQSINPDLDNEDIDLEEELNNLIIDGNDKNNHGDISNISDDGTGSLKTDDDLDDQLKLLGNKPSNSISEDINKKKIAVKINT